MVDIICNCSNCFFNKIPLNICQRFPPVYIERAGEWKQPNITKDGYCGEWKLIE